MRHPFKICLCHCYTFTWAGSPATWSLVALRTCTVKDSLFKRKLTVKVHLVKSNKKYTLNLYSNRKTSANVFQRALWISQILGDNYPNTYILLLGIRINNAKPPRSSLMCFPIRLFIAIIHYMPIIITIIIIVIIPLNVIGSRPLK